MKTFLTLFLLTTSIHAFQFIKAEVEPRAAVIELTASFNMAPKAVSLESTTVVNVCPKAVNLEVTTTFNVDPVVNVNKALVEVKGPLVAKQPEGLVKISLFSDLHFDQPLVYVVCTIPKGMIDAKLTVEPHAIASPETTITGGWGTLITVILGVGWLITKIHRHATNDPVIRPIGFFQNVLHILF